MDKVPPAWRLLAAFIVSPAIAAFAFACYAPAYAGIPDLYDRIFGTFYVALVVGAYPATLLFGVPAYFLFRTRLRPTVLNCAIVGAIVAALPWLLIGFFSSPDYASSDGHVTAQNGHITLWGLIDLAKLIGPIALLGSFTGCVFWAIAVAGIRRAADSVGDPDQISI